MENKIELTVEEQRLLADINHDLPAHLQAALAQGGMVFVKSVNLQEKINHFRSTIGARLAAESASKPFIAPPRTPENSWEPSEHEEALISAYLETLEPEWRELALDRLLRNNTRLMGTDQRSKQMLDDIYKARNDRWAAE
jgi:hypothetical protein